MHKEARNDPQRASRITESPLNSLGYALCNLDRKDEAIEVMKINTCEFTGSWNAFDSLGDIYLGAGMKNEAIEAYRESLRLNPANGHAVEVLKGLDKWE